MLLHLSIMMVLWALQIHSGNCKLKSNFLGAMSTKCYDCVHKVVVLK
jgi:hypothetical protein